jgi:hypothetical protein
VIQILRWASPQSAIRQKVILVALKPHSMSILISAVLSRSHWQVMLLRLTPHEAGGVCNYPAACCAFANQV